MVNLLAGKEKMRMLQIQHDDGSWTTVLIQWIESELPTAIHRRYPVNVGTRNRSAKRSLVIEYEPRNVEQFPLRYAAEWSFFRFSGNALRCQPNPRTGMIVYDGGVGFEEKRWASPISFVITMGPGWLRPRPLERARRSRTVNTRSRRKKGSKMVEGWTEDLVLLEL